MRKLAFILLVLAWANTHAQSQGWWETSVNAACTGQQFESLDAVQQCYEDATTSLYVHNIIDDWYNYYTVLFQTKYVANDNDGPGFTAGFVCPEGVNRIDTDFGPGCENDPPPGSCADTTGEYVFTTKGDQYNIGIGEKFCVSKNGQECLYEVGFESINSGFRSLDSTGQNCDGDPDNPPEPWPVPSGEWHDMTRDKFPNSDERNPIQSETTPINETTTDSPNPGDTTTTTGETTDTTGGDGTKTETTTEKTTITTSDGLNHTKTTTTTVTTHPDGSTTTTEHVEYSQDPSTTVEIEIQWGDDGQPAGHPNQSTLVSEGLEGSSTTTTTADSDGNVTGSSTEETGDGEEGGEDAPFNPSDNPQVDSFQQSIEKYYQRIQNAPIVNAFNNLTGTMSAGSCPALNMETPWGGVNTQIHCDLMSNVGPTLSLVMQAVWVLFGAIIFLKA
jgi:hypothetical protein